MKREQTKKTSEFLSCLLSNYSRPRVLFSFGRERNESKREARRRHNKIMNKRREEGKKRKSLESLDERHPRKRNIRTTRHEERNKKKKSLDMRERTQQST